MKENTKFVLRVMLIHIATYFFCGMIFSVLFNYNDLFQLGNAKYFMRTFAGASTLFGPVFQIFRGLLFGLVLLLIKNAVIENKYGWLKLWAIIAIIGIINTPAPAPFSIEGIIYTQLPLEFHLKGAPEILIQTLLFSYWVANPVKVKKNSFFEQNKIPVVSAIIAGVMFSFSGIIIALILKADMMAATSDIGAFVIMFAAIAIVFIICKWYKKTSSKFKNILLPVACYVVLAVAPTVYNNLTASAFASWLTLAINIVPVIIIFLINYNAGKHSLRKN